jgi:glycosyltransferase involved in cell wall biosynthesis
VRRNVARRARCRVSPLSDTQLRVLHLIKSLSVIGGAEQLLLSVTAASQHSERIECHVAHVFDRPSPHLVTELESAGVALHALRVRSHYDLRWLVRLRRLLDELDVDVLHVHLPYAASLGRLVARSVPRGPMIVHTQHNIWQHNVPMVRLLHRLTYRLDDADIAVSHAAWSALPRRLRKRTEILVHGVPLRSEGDRAAAQAAVRAEFGVRPQDALVTTVANFRKEKGYEVLLEAARLLVDQGVDVHFLAVGSGPLEDEVRRACDLLGLRDRVTFAGFRPDAQRIVAGSDLFLLASHHEGFPVAVMEALAVGVPVVSTAVGDVPRALKDGTCGLIVPPGDPRALAGAVGRLVTDPDTRAQMASATKAAALRYDIGRVCVRVEEIYESLLPRRHIGLRQPVVG